MNIKGVTKRYSILGIDNQDGAVCASMDAVDGGKVLPCKCGALFSGVCMSYAFFPLPFQDGGHRFDGDTFRAYTAKPARSYSVG